MRHVEEHGTLDVPHTYVTDDGVALGSWLTNQRYAIRSGMLPVEQAELLADLGVKPDRQGRTTAEWLREVAAYLAEHGDLDIPQQYVTPTGARLGIRLNGWRKLHRRGALPDDLRVTLATLGMDLGRGPDPDRQVQVRDGHPHQVIADRLRTLIADGTYPAGSRLPSGHVIAQEYGVATNTVSAAMRILWSEGLVASRQGSGVYVL